MNEVIAQRLAHEIEELKKLPSEGLVRHREIKRTSDGLWYRVSEWVDSEDWGDLVRSDRLKDLRTAFDLFKKIADILDMLHESGQIIPHLILNDILVVKSPDGGLDVKIDYKMSRFIDPKLDQPPPMLADLIACHPDIIDGRPLDIRSSIWSLGKIFVEILTADFEICDHAAGVDTLVLPHRAELLFKTMLAKDPRPSPQIDGGCVRHPVRDYR